MNLIIVPVYQELRQILHKFAKLILSIQIYEYNDAKLFGTRANQHINTVK